MFLIYLYGSEFEEYDFLSFVSIFAKKLPTESKIKTPYFPSRFRNGR